jgi:BMFP domain-containing protein YqiC
MTMATKTELEARVEELESLVTLDSIKPSGVEQLHELTGGQYAGGGKRPARKRKPAAKPKPKPKTTAQRIADLEARVDELEAYEATDEFGQKIYPPDPNCAWADSRRLFEKAREAWALRNGKELRRRQVAKGQPA